MKMNVVPMGRRNEHSRGQLRHMAISAAARLIEAEGIAALSARKIALEMGYTAGSLYLLFDHLDDLVLHVNARTLDELYQRLAGVAASCSDPHACIMSLAHAYAGFAAENPARWEAVFLFRLSSGHVLPAWFQEKVERMFVLVEAQMIRLDATRNASNGARALWSGVHGVCLLASSGKLEVVGAQSVSALIDTLVGSFLAGYHESEGG